MNLSFIFGFLIVCGLALDVDSLCLKDSGCEETEYCKWFVAIFVPFPRCVDLCDNDDTCGANAYCVAENHKENCKCQEGYQGNPNQGCVESCEAKCGSNTNCEMYGSRAFCGCKDGFSGNPYDRNEGCRPAPGLIDAEKCWSEDRDNPSAGCVKYFNQRPRKQFVIMQEKTNWFDALRLCAVENKMLAIIENRFDQESLEAALVEIGLNSQKVWLAGSDLKKRGRFQWVAGSTFNTIEFTNWHNGEPRDNRHCVALGQRFSWVAEDCSQSYAFVCQNK